MIIFGGSRGGCGMMGCLPLVLVAIVITSVVLALSGGSVFFFGV
jgi:hypothetical protein